jgi:hypothetical protein
VSVYNVYTGALARSLAGVVTQAGPMTVSGDGKLLYVYDQASQTVVEVDATSGAVTHTYPSGAGTAGNAIAYVRPSGISMLITPAWRIFDVATYREYDPALPLLAYPLQNSSSLSVSPDSSKIINGSGDLEGLFRTALNGGSLTLTSLRGSSSDAITSQSQACISPDGQTAYSDIVVPYDFLGTSLATYQTVQDLPGEAYPVAIACGWNSLVIGGANAPSAPTDIFVYYGPTGAQLGLLNSSSLTASDTRGLVPRGLAVSADGTQLITLAQHLINGANELQGDEVYFQPLPAPPVPQATAGRKRAKAPAARPSGSR